MPTVYRLNGKEVTRKEFMRGSKGLRGGVPQTQRTAAWPRASYAMAVHPDQVPEVMARDRKHGVPTEYNQHGEPIFTSRGHRKRYCESHGYFDRNGGYGDPQKRN